MDNSSILANIECLLFVSGDPVQIVQIQEALGVTEVEAHMLLNRLREDLEARNGGIILYLTDSSAQLVSNPDCYEFVRRFYQPPQEKSISQSMMETLAIIAYRQPVTRGDVEAIRGVRCEYAVSQLLKQGFITELGRRDTVGRPMEFGTTDAFLRLFGLRSLRELPKLDAEAETSAAEDSAFGDAWN
ncbi:MAG: SMC-Scp complex subunit ScpB [Clostridia bacterium]|nr:SMC-Scp complex subunit ScpB [Clostridia bacterium]